MGALAATRFAAQKSFASVLFDRKLDFGDVARRVLIDLVIGVKMQVDLANRPGATVAVGLDPGENSLSGQEQAAKEP
jgi:hypothetical protein